MSIFKLKLRILMDNGQTVIIKCKSFEATKLTGTVGSRSLDIKKPDRVWTIDISKVCAITAKNCLF
ncbi:MAG: hypothetical protein WC319_07595 [Candidatus Paceibacterota bacterium]|jgi:hypothetical protein